MFNSLNACKSKYLENKVISLWRAMSDNSG
jgi:hypothetical protein